MVEAGGRQRLSVRWLLLPWMVLLLLSIALPLCVGAGISGLLGFVSLLLVVAVLGLVAWLLATPRASCALASTGPGRL